MAIGLVRAEYSITEVFDALQYLPSVKRNKEVSRKLTEWAKVADVRIQEYDTTRGKKVKVLIIRDAAFNCFSGNTQFRFKQALAITIRGHVFMPESIQKIEKGEEFRRCLDHEYWHARSRLPSFIDLEHSAIKRMLATEQITLDLVSKRIAEEFIAHVGSGDKPAYAIKALKLGYESELTQINPDYFKNSNRYKQLVDEMAGLVAKLHAKEKNLERTQEQIEEGTYPYSDLKK